MELKNRALDGAKIVLSKCLSLEKGDTLTIFWDEAAEETADIFKLAARELHIKVRERKVPLEEQSVFEKDQELSIEDSEALREARGIITCLSTHAKGTSYRLKLLEVGTSIGTRFGHMPGANLDLLSHAAVKIDYDEACRRCDDLALALTLGEKAVLQTYIFDKGEPVETFELAFDLGGVNRPAITSTGIIAPGTWGNIPGGETFIAPMENTAEGIFVLNGAFKNYIFTESSYLLLHFSQGNLIKIDGNPEARQRLEGLFNDRRSDDEFYKSLAELGIGVNTEITELTGTALFDEKCAGTAHIAVGDNKRYGGYHHSTIHEDMISRAPTLRIDGKTILFHGKNVFNASEWRETLKVEPGEVEKNNLLSRTEIPAQKSETGALQVFRSVTSGRICIYTVAEPKTNKLLAKVYQRIPGIPQEIEVKDLILAVQRTSQISEAEILAAIRILERHKLISQRRQMEM